MNPLEVTKARIVELDSIIEAADAQAARTDIGSIAYYSARQRAGAARKELSEKNRWLDKNAAKYPDPTT